MSEEEKSELMTKILMELPYVDIKPYSHNIIAITLKIIEEKFGEEESIRMMKECHLDKHGWCVPKQKKSLNEIIYGTNFP